jgi:hypothetical protein
MKNWTCLAVALISISAYAGAPNPCVQPVFSQSGNGWKSIFLKLTNGCSVPVDMQNSIITFKTSNSLSTPFWGLFGPLEHPDNHLMITSESLRSGGYLATLPLHFPVADWSNTVLPVGSSITLEYGEAIPGYVSDSVVVITN